VRRFVLRIAKLAAVLLALAVGAVGTLLASMWHEHTSPIVLPSPTGSFALGRAQYAWINPKTSEELAVWIWYPARPSSTATSVEYLPAPWRTALREHQGTFLRSFFKRDPLAVGTHATSNAAVAPDRRAYPVVVLRPGGSALTTDFTSIAEDLASHGYIVAGFDAPARSFVMVTSDGRTIARAPENNVENANGNLSDPIVGRLLAMWTSDTRFVADQLERVNNGSISTPLAGRMDVERLAIVGHSFGGATALQFCHEDIRCRAAIDMDGIPFGTVVPDGLHKPAMFLLSDHRREMADPAGQQVVREIQSIYDRLPPPRLHATIRTANHFTFSDQSLLNSQIALALLRLTGFGGLDARRGLAMSADFVRTFFDVALNGASPAALLQVSERYPEVVVISR
jgi:pimeloyl-ACP methyl ester carboxylesterase